MSQLLYGECVCGKETATVRISALFCEGCELVSTGRSAPHDGECSLWIGAVGPFPAMAMRTGSRRFALRFKEPLDGKILSHFACH